MPRVSVVIPTYNCERFLGRAIDTALGQSYKDYEILVVDDGSTDKTPDLMGRYDGKVRYFRQSNRGVSAARNLALSHATGEFIAYLDADDMWRPQKLALQVDFLNGRRECGLVHTEIAVVDEHGVVVHPSFNRDTQRSVPQGRCLKDLLRHCHIQTLTVMERRECIDRVGNFDERLPIAQDFSHWIDVALSGFAIGYLSEPLAEYRWREGSLMASQSRYLEDLVLIYERLLQRKADLQDYGSDLLDVISQELFSKRYQLAYADRAAGRYDKATSRVWHLICERPSALSLYIEFVKGWLGNVFGRSSTRP